MRSTLLLASLATVALAFVACSGGVSESPGAAGSQSSGFASMSSSTSGSGGSICAVGAAGGKAVCGNCVLEPEEECDDGNKVNADGCEADCTLPKCGNGIVDPGEVCWGGAMINYPLHNSGAQLLVAVCDADGDLDVITLGIADPAWQVEALRNDGAGVLGNSVVTDVPTYTTQFATGEFNGAPGQDLVIASGNEGSETGTFRILRGQDTCAYNVVDKMMGLPMVPSDIALLRLDSDLIDDFIAPFFDPLDPSQTPQLAYYTSTSKPPAAVQLIEAFSTSPTAIAAGKLDDNDSEDVAYVDSGNQAIVVRFNIGGAFGPPNMFPADAVSTCLALGDVDGDNDLDIVAGNGGGITVFINDGTGSFLATPFVVTNTGLSDGSPPSVALGDVDKDGDLDALTLSGGYLGDGVWNPTPTFWLLLNDGSGHYTIATTAAFPMVEKDSPIELTTDADSNAKPQLVDLNGDGALDIVTSTFLNDVGNVTVLLARP